MISQLINENRSLLGNEKVFDILEKYIPLNYYMFPSGAKCFDWNVPQKWIVKKGIIKDITGKVAIDVADNILHLVGYSNSFKGWISKNEMTDHIYVGPDIPYRTAYYGDFWGFCMTGNQFLKLKGDRFFVDIETEFVDSNLEIGECKIEGESKKEIILTSYLCHPNQANDGLSGVQLLVDLYNKLKKSHNKFTYRFFFMPETIGSLALLSHKIIKPEDVEFAMVATCVGVGDELCYKKTYLGNHTIDNIASEFADETYDFEPWGSDERQFSSPKIRIPTCSLMRTRWQDFGEYHTAADNLDLISLERIEDTAEIYWHILKKYENDKRYIINHEGGEPFLTKHDLYRIVSIPGHETLGKVINWVVFLSDGINTISDMVAKSGFKKEEIEDVIEMLLKKEIIK